MFRIVRGMGSLFGMGRRFPAPGTWASAVGALVAWVFQELLFGTCLILLGAGAVLSFYAPKAFGSEDPREFVWDELCGAALSFLWLPRNLWVWGLGLALFRLLDIWKPWPICLLQRSKNPLSILGDDVAAGLLTNITLRLMIRAIEALT